MYHATLPGNLGHGCSARTEMHEGASPSLRIVPPGAIQSKKDEDNSSLHSSFTPFDHSDHHLVAAFIKLDSGFQLRSPRHRESCGRRCVSRRSGARGDVSAQKFGAGFGASDESRSPVVPRSFASSPAVSSMQKEHARHGVYFYDTVEGPMVARDVRRVARLKTSPGRAYTSRIYLAMT